MKTTLVTLEAAVRSVVAKHGGVRAAERATGIDKSFISRLMNGHKVAPSAETLESLGLRAVPLYEVLKRPNGPVKRAPDQKPADAPAVRAPLELVVSRLFEKGTYREVPCD